VGSNGGPRAARQGRGRRPTGQSPRVLSRATTAALFALLLLAIPTPSANAAGPTITTRAELFADTTTNQPFFLLGANYEGPADRAWRMWEDTRFDPLLIAADFDRARSAGLAALRVFVQRPLADDVLAGRWGKLDRVLNLAEQRGLKLIVTFADYEEHDLARLVAVQRALAGRYRDRATVLAYDLKNEPRFFDLALAAYPPGAGVALQRPELVAAVGESLPRARVAEHRAAEAGRRDVPRRLNDDQAYVYANTLDAYRRFLAEAQAWATARGATSVGYFAAPESGRWAPLKDALDAALAAWLRPQVDALRAADPGRPITVGHVDALIGSLPANADLDYLTLHRYPAASTAGIAAAMRLFDDVRAALPGQPLVLGEFGFATAQVEEPRAAALEAEVVRAWHARGGAGALKWMLNDFPNPDNQREGTLGMFRADGSAKPSVAALGALTGLRPLPALVARAARPADYPLPGGRFFTQTNGRPPGAGGRGYAVTNADGVPFWDAFQRLGGVPAVGYPVGRRFLLDGFVVQPMQKAVFQWHPGERRVNMLNTYDRLHDAGRDDWLRSVRQTPPPFDTAPDAGLPWDRVVARHMALLDANPAVRARYLAEPAWLERFGLPVSVADYPGVYVVRAQRAVLQQWKTAVPWARAGEVTVANGGDVAREAGLFPAEALRLEPPP
jgi:hypothetical protein